MSLNTIHNTSKDLITGKNLTNNSVFRFEVLGTRETAKFAFSQGLNIDAIKLAIKVNGKCDLKMDDTVEVLGNNFIVCSISASIENNRVLKHRNDIENIQGNTIVGLQ